MRITFEEDFEDDGVIKCPRCDGFYLHHGKIEVFDREASEDGPGISTTIGHLFDVKKKVSEHDMPGRRDSLNISFWCEGCGKIPYVLKIMQHKGNTYIRWEEIDFDSDLRSKL